MTLEQIENVVGQFVAKSIVSISPLGNGHIHRTWKVDFEGNSIVLQQFNHQIFTKPEIVDANIHRVTEHLLQQANYPLQVLQMLPASNGQTLLQQGVHCFRAFPYLNNSTSIDKVENTSTARKIAQAFGSYNASLLGLDPATLSYSLSDFHNGALRHQALLESARLDRCDRLRHCKALVENINNLHDETAEIDALKQDGTLPLRITHYDTKVNNILLDEQTEEPLMVIDLDTTMPGTWLSDYGDMIRTATPTRDENETDLDEVHFRLDLFTAITEGYLSATSKYLNTAEKRNLLAGGKYLILMQCERFLADYLNGDIYYGSKYEGQNLDRAHNQFKLLTSIRDQETQAQKIISQLI